MPEISQLPKTCLFTPLFQPNRRWPGPTGKSITYTNTARCRIRHRAVFVYVIDLPVGPGHRLLGWNNGVNRQVFGSWEISGITTLQTGTPFTVFNSLQDFSGFNALN